MPEIKAEITKSAVGNVRQLPLASNTESAIINGTVLSHVGLTEKWLKLAKEKLGQNTVIIATGGWSETLSHYTQIFEQVDRNLTLKGIT